MTVWHPVLAAKTRAVRIPEEGGDHELDFELSMKPFSTLTNRIFITSAALAVVSSAWPSPSSTSA